jgi:hypothetical protein
MNNIWREKMNIGDLIEFDEEFYNSLKAANIDIKPIGIIKEAKELFYRVQTGTLDDLWVSKPDIKKINLDKYKK